MHSKNLPPTLRSIVQCGMVKPFGPYHYFNSSASVQQRHTSDRGASNTRVISSSPSILFFVCICASPFCIVWLL